MGRGVGRLTDETHPPTWHGSSVSDAKGKQGQQMDFNTPRTFLEASSDRGSPLVDTDDSPDIVYEQPSPFWSPFRSEGVTESSESYGGFSSGMSGVFSFRGLGERLERNFPVGP